MTWTFYSPSKGLLTLDEVVEDVLCEVEGSEDNEFRIMVGTDSQPKPASHSVTFVTAIIVHHVGKGGRYYVHREQHHHTYALRQRMMTEAAYSLQIGGLLSEKLNTSEKTWSIEVHLDIGEQGATKQVVREIVSWITSSGYEAKIKPDAYGASKVADRYTKHG
ncbi:ribonuclease H-like YkuK family protein [Alicyclobacillus ferrooxydans]|uniref:DUF458 domain-containing protein n=1 Tax=Alicyclobacillus ferrooxydans TaxID=471514 RepID=A0A0P9D5B5_9BACL|nr:ribonuclease H-like YkuK family protein [Alicyclobacillus ferrooxydans]KPV44638.1 hypothetical protein AN477_06595 [Alicyclobacillus ferrooxydans]